MPRLGTEQPHSACLAFNWPACGLVGQHLRQPCCTERTNEKASLSFSLYVCLFGSIPTPTLQDSTALYCKIFILAIRPPVSWPWPVETRVEGEN